MESPPDPTSDPGNSASESATPVRETPVNLETLRKAEHQAPVRRQSCSSTNRVDALQKETQSVTGSSVWLLKVDSHHHSQCYFTRSTVGRSGGPCLPSADRRRMGRKGAEVSKQGFCTKAFQKPGAGTLLMLVCLTALFQKACDILKYQGLGFPCVLEQGTVEVTLLS
ncbi:hypothetical protein MHYP_G00178600 [Metynnis hypsauchen]